MRRPPTTKPLAPAAAPAALHAARARLRARPSSALASSRLRAAGTVRAEDAPWTARAATSCVPLPASAPSAPASGEDGQTGEQHPTVPEPLAEAGAEDQQPAEEHRVGGGQRPRPRRRGADPVEHRRDGHDGTGDAEHVDELDEAEHHDRGHRGVLGPRRAGGCTACVPAPRPVHSRQDPTRFGPGRDAASASPPSPRGGSVGAEQPAWWRHAVVYQVYPRSFADGNGDGEGDLPGLRARLPYLADLGVDGLWISPWFPSPMADGGYDVSDFRDIHPMFGTLDDADALLTRGPRARAAGDHRPGAQPHLRPAPVVPRRPGGRRPVRPSGPATSSATAAAPRARSRRTTGSAPSVVRPGRGSPSRTGTAGQWYLHLFAPEQPDLDWTQRGTCWPTSTTSCGSGSTAGSTGCGSTPPRRWPRRTGCPTPTTAGCCTSGPSDWDDNPHWDVDTVHDIFRRWRAHRRHLRRRPGVRRRGGRQHHPSGWPATCGPTRCTPPSTSPTSRGRGTRRRCAQVIDATLVGIRADRRAVDLGADQPRRDPPRHPLRPRHDQLVLHRGRRRRGLGPRARHPPRAGRRAAHAGPARRRLRLPGRGARAARRWRTCPTRCCRTRCSPAAAASCVAATGAGCRCRGAARSRRSGSPPTGSSRGCRSRAPGPR